MLTGNAYRGHVTLDGTVNGRRQGRHAYDNAGSRSGRRVALGMGFLQQPHGERLSTQHPSEDSGALPLTLPIGPSTAPALESLRPCLVMPLEGVSMETTYSGTPHR